MECVNTNCSEEARDDMVYCDHCWKAYMAQIRHSREVGEFVKKGTMPSEGDDI